MRNETPAGRDLVDRPILKARDRLHVRGRNIPRAVQVIQGGEVFGVRARALARSV
jgi:hypothetical protein